MSIMQHGRLKICRPCGEQNPTHLGCTDPCGKGDKCYCFATSWVHCTKFSIPERGDFERDYAHDTGEDEFDNWIADSARALEEEIA